MLSDTTVARSHTSEHSCSVIRCGKGVWDNKRSLTSIFGKREDTDKSMDRTGDSMNHSKHASTSIEAELGVTGASETEIFKVQSSL